jgi:hypothetical protein
MSSLGLQPAWRFRQRHSKEEDKRVQRLPQYRTCSTRRPCPRAGTHGETRLDRPTVVGKELAIRFVNTVAWRQADQQQKERLPSAEAFLAWFAGAEVFDGRFLRALALEWRNDPVLAENKYRTALALRETIYRELHSAASDKAPAKTDVALLSHLLDAGTLGMQLSAARVFRP